MSAEREKYEPVEGEVVSIDRKSGRMNFRNLKQVRPRDNVTEKFLWYFADGQPPLELQVRPYAIDAEDFQRLFDEIGEAQDRELANKKQVETLTMKLGELRGQLEIAQLGASADIETPDIKATITTIEGRVSELKNSGQYIDIMAEEFLCKAIASWPLEGDDGKTLPVTLESFRFLVRELGEPVMVDLYKALQSFFLQVIKEVKSGRRRYKHSPSGT